MPTNKKVAVVKEVQAKAKEIKVRYGTGTWIEKASEEELKDFARKQNPQISLPKGADISAMRTTIRRVLGKRRSAMAKRNAGKVKTRVVIENADVPVSQQSEVEVLKQELHALRLQLAQATGIVSEVPAKVVVEEPVLIITEAECVETECVGVVVVPEVVPEEEVELIEDPTYATLDQLTETAATLRAEILATFKECAGKEGQDALRKIVLELEDRPVPQTSNLSGYATESWVKDFVREAREGAVREAEAKFNEWIEALVDNLPTKDRTTFWKIVRKANSYMMEVPK